MLALYLFSMVLGGGFLLLSVLGGDGGDTDLDLGSDVDFDTGADAYHDAGASKVFSLRGAVYTLFGFGATGSLLTWAGIGGLVALGSAIGGGLASGLLITGVFSYLNRTESGANWGDDSLVGRMGRITLPLGAGSAGSVVITRGDREITLRALPHGSGNGDPASWERIVVVEIDTGGIARVAPITDQEISGLNPGSAE